MLEVRLFAALAEEAGARSLTLPLDKPTTVSELKHLLGKQLPDLRDKVDKCMVAVNHEYADNEDAVSVNDEVVLIPPVSGG